jgi:SET domain-containing protein 6
MAYSFTEPEREEDSDIDTEDMPITKSPPMMVPVADILNHIAKNNASLQFGKESLKMVSTRDIRKVRYIKLSFITEISGLVLITGLY